MKRTLLLMVLIAALLIVAILIVQSTKAAETLGDLQSFRWHAMSLMNVSTSGTPQITTAFVDSVVVMAEQIVGTDFALSSYLTNTDSQTVTATLPVGDTTRTQVYAMNSDFIPGGLVTVLRLPWGTRDFGYYRISAGPPDLASPPPLPDGEAPPAYVWTEGNLLIIQPAPRQADKFLLFYRALPRKMIHADSTTEVDPPLRRMIVVLAAADIAKRLNLTGREAALRAEYAAFKRERLILPAAALGGNQ